MPVHSHEAFAGHEAVTFISDNATGLRAIVAIHDTTRGPALGGCRMYAYASEEAALRDVLRLARGMTYKAAAANLRLGGGKAVIIGDPRELKTPALMRAMGRAVERLAGTYITAEDVGTTVADFAEVRKETAHVVGLPTELGGSGDPSPTTALGVYYGLLAAAAHRWNREDLSGLTVAVQGLGNVGWHLCQLLAEAGAQLIVCDVDDSRVAKAVATFSALACRPDRIYDAEADIFAPCALGAIINHDTLPRMKFSVIGGAANNQLAQDDQGEILRTRGIVYAPDFVINAGGMMRVASELTGFDQARVDSQVEGIRDTLLSIFARADAEAISTQRAAMQIAEERLHEFSSPAAGPPVRVRSRA
jgi:leucine dehydrogenase